MFMEKINIFWIYSSWNFSINHAAFRQLINLQL